MKKSIYLILLLSLLLVLAGCGNTENTTKVKKDENTSVISDKQQEMSSDNIILYMEQMTWRYSTSDTLNHTGEKELEYLTKAILDVQSSVLEIEHDYDSDIPVVQDLLELGAVIENALNKLRAGDKSTKYEDSVKSGEIIGDISKKYLNGELPPTIKRITGIENTND